MAIPHARLRLLGAALVLALGAGALSVGAEVTSREQATPEVEPTIPAEPVHQRSLRLQCWQEGGKIIDRDELQGLALSAAIRTNTSSFKQEGDAQPSVFLLPFNDAICLIQPSS